VALAAERLAGSPVGVCAVVAFPFGASTARTKAYEAGQAIADGASEVDAVLNVGALKSGDVAAVRKDVDAVTAACRHGRTICKVIIEAGLLTDAEKIEACRIVQAAGAEFVKTSTGFAGAGATAADVALIRRVVGSAMGIKAAGGIRDLATLEAMVAAGATRIGTSAGVQIVSQALASCRRLLPRPWTPGFCHVRSGEVQARRSRDAADRRRRPRDRIRRDGERTPAPARGYPPPSQRFDSIAARRDSHRRGTGVRTNDPCRRPSPRRLPAAGIESFRGPSSCG
jgi:deoxyribose-phosphate aldolase